MTTGHRLTFSRYARQAGITSLHMVGLLIMIALVQAALAGYQLRQASDTLGTAVGGQARNIKQALDNYLITFGPAIMANKPVTDKVTTVLVALKPTLEELAALGFLHAVPGRPANGGEWEIVIETQPPACTIPGPCNLRSTVIPTAAMTARSNPDAIDGVALNAAVRAIGADGGYSEIATPGLVTGAGGWSRTNRLGEVPGVLHAIGGYGSATYNAPLNLGDACELPGAVATATTGQQLICRGTRWVTTIQSLSNWSTVAKVLVKDGDLVPKPVCEAGGTAAYSFEMTQTAVDVAIAPPLQSMYLAAKDAGSGWQIVIHMKDKNTTDVSANPYSISSIFHVQCHYSSS